jgi:hypothetical protein
LPITRTCLLSKRRSFARNKLKQDKPGKTSQNHSRHNHLHNLLKSYLSICYACQPVRSRAPSASMNVTLHTRYLAFFTMGYRRSRLMPRQQHLTVQWLRHDFEPQTLPARAYRLHPQTSGHFRDLRYSPPGGGSLKMSRWQHKSACETMRY